MPPCTACARLSESNDSTPHRVPHCYPLVRIFLHHEYVRWTKTSILHNECDTECGVASSGKTIVVMSDLTARVINVEHLPIQYATSLDIAAHSARQSLTAQTGRTACKWFSWVPIYGATDNPAIAGALTALTSARFYKNVLRAAECGWLKYKNTSELAYLQLLRATARGIEKRGRNGTTRMLIAQQLRFPLVRICADADVEYEPIIPLLTTKKVNWHAVVVELLWFLRGETTTEYLHKYGVKIWDANSTREFLDSRGLAYEEGQLGPIYGFQWRHFGAALSQERAGEHVESVNSHLVAPTRMRGCAAANGVDQIARALDMLKRDPFDRRILVSAWNAAALDQMALPPCLTERAYVLCCTFANGAPADAPIYTTKRIDQITTADYVVSAAGRARRVEYVFKTQYAGAGLRLQYSITEADQTRMGELVVTPNHPFYATVAPRPRSRSLKRALSCKREQAHAGEYTWMEARELTVGARVQCLSVGALEADYAIITAIERVTLNEPVYNLDVETDHTYIAGYPTGADLSPRGAADHACVRVRADHAATINFTGLVNHNCHYAFHFIVLPGNSAKNILNCVVNMRSADLALGVPFNIASYALLTHIFAGLTNLRAGELVLNLEDCHVYENHLERIQEWLTRAPTQYPVLQMPTHHTLEEVCAAEPDAFVVRDYYPQAYIPLKMN